jgi:hypothetical protein
MVFSARLLSMGTSGCSTNRVSPDQWSSRLWSTFFCLICARFTHIKSPERRDRLFLLNAFAIFLMTLLGAAGESLGFDRLLKANTVKYRTHSLFRQGGLYFGLIPKMPEERLRPLIRRFGEMLTQQPTTKDVLAMA